MKTFNLDMDTAPSIKFTGELLASVESSCNPSIVNRYSGQINCWTELYLYKTKGGNFVCHQIERTYWRGEHDSFSGKVCKTLEDVKEFFGHYWLAKELYVNAGINDTIEIE